MKTNKLAAGALALALGLGAVTPAFAAESTKTGNEKKGEVIVTQAYRDAETRFVKAFKAVNEAEAELAKLTETRDAKLAELNKAEANLKAYREQLADLYDQVAAQNEIGKKTGKQFIANGGNVGTLTEANWTDFNDSHLVAEGTTNALTGKTVSANDAASQVANLRDLQGIKDKIDELNAEIAALYDNGNTENNLKEIVDRASEAYEEASSYVVRQKDVLSDAKSEYSDAKDAFIKAGADRAAIGEAEKYGDLKYITVDPAEKDSESKEDVLAKAEKAYEDARVTVKAVELIKVTAPKVYENNKVAIDAYLEKANAAINKLGKALGKKVAVSDLLFSTAYADEEASLEEIKDLTKEVEDVDKEGKELLENINKQEEEADKEEDNKDKPADKDDNKDKPADKDDDKEADKKDEKDEKEADKKDEKKPAAKKASSNAKTGVAGVTGVAGILAAASVAYAASKKRD